MVNVERGVEAPPGPRVPYICHLFIHLLNMHVLFVRLCVSTEDTALDVVSTVSAPVGLRIHQGTQTLAEVLTDVMSTGQQGTRTLGRWAWVYKHPLCYHLRGPLALPHQHHLLTSCPQSAPAQTPSEIRTIYWCTYPPVVKALRPASTQVMDSVITLPMSHVPSLRLAVAEK